jgi:hypothetical protein
MARMTPEALETFLAFGTASIAVFEAAKRMARGHLDGPSSDLFVEMQAAHSRLRVLFDQELDDDVLVLARSIVELAQRTAWALDQEESRPGS